MILDLTRKTKVKWFETRTHWSLQGPTCPGLAPSSSPAPMTGPVGFGIPWPLGGANDRWVCSAGTGGCSEKSVVTAVGLRIFLGRSSENDMNLLSPMFLNQFESKKIGQSRR